MSTIISTRVPYNKYGIFIEDIVGTILRNMETSFKGICVNIIVHVIIGTVFLLVGALRVYTYQVTNTHHVGVESGIFYGHFVDVVWLFLFGAVYFWGGQGKGE